jgi:hypothetical protein
MLANLANVMGVNPDVQWKDAPLSLVSLIRIYGSYLVNAVRNAWISMAFVQFLETHTIRLSTANSIASKDPASTN